MSLSSVIISVCAFHMFAAGGIGDVEELFPFVTQCLHPSPVLSAMA